MNKMLTILGASLLTSVAMAADLRIGVVDYLAINTETSFFRDAAAKMQESEKSNVSDVQALAKQTADKQAQLADTKTKLTDEQRKAIQADLAQLHQKMDGERQKAQAKMMMSRKNMMDQAMDSLRDVVKQVSDEEHCAFVLRKESIAYAPDMVDLTTKVVAKIKATSPNAKPAPNQALKQSS